MRKLILLLALGLFSLNIASAQMAVGGLIGLELAGGTRSDFNNNAGENKLYLNVPGGVQFGYKIGAYGQRDFWHPTAQAELIFNFQGFARKTITGTNGIRYTTVELPLYVRLEMGDGSEWGVFYIGTGIQPGISIVKKRLINTGSTFPEKDSKTSFNSNDNRFQTGILGVIGGTRDFGNGFTFIEFRVVKGLNKMYDLSEARNISLNVVAGFAFYIWN